MSAPSVGNQNYADAESGDLLPAGATAPVRPKSPFPEPEVGVGRRTRKHRRKNRKSRKSGKSRKSNRRTRK